MLKAALPPALNLIDRERERRPASCQVQDAFRVKSDTGARLKRPEYVSAVLTSYFFITVRSGRHGPFAPWRVAAFHHPQRTIYIRKRHRPPCTELKCTKGNDECASPITSLRPRVESIYCAPELGRVHADHVRVGIASPGRCWHGGHGSQRPF